MAHSEEIWNKARGFYEAGLSLSQIKERTGIARNTISKRAKKEQWEQGKNTDYIEAKEIIAQKKGTISEQREQVFLNCADEIAEENIRYKNLINNNATKLANKLNMMTDEVAEAQDLKHLVEANDKLAITLKVADRHAPKIDITQNQAQQNINDTKRVTIAKRSDRAE